MTLLQFVLLVVFGGLVLGFGVMWGLANLKRVRVVSAAASASDQQLETIYRLIERGGELPVSCCVLGRLNQRADAASNVVNIPPALADFPWAGRGVEVTVAQTVQCRFTDAPHAGTHLAGKVFRAVGVPCQCTEAGDRHNCFYPNRYLANNPELAQALAQLSPRYPQALLSHLLCVGSAGVHYEAIDQARIGGPAAWMRTPQPVLCEHCQQEMTLILQLPGSVLGDDRHHEATFYWLGCREHTDTTQMVVQ